MRITHNDQMNFQDLRPQWTKAKEFKGMNTILEENAQVFEIAERDFVTKKGARSGRPGMTVEQVVRIAPPLIITKEEADWALERIGQALAVKHG